MSECRHKGEVLTCRECGRDFCSIARYYIPKMFCSRKCQSEFLRKHPSLPEKVKKYPTAKSLHNASIEVIKRYGRYVTIDELARKLHICSKEYTAFGIDIIELNLEAGYKKPVSVAAVIVKKYLSKFTNDVKQEVTFGGLTSTKGMLLRYDLGSEKKRLLVELDGAMHNSNHSWYNEHRNENDRLKDASAKYIAYTLVRIPVHKVYTLTDEYLDSIFLPILGNQKPEAEGIPSNGSETDSASRPDAAAAGKPARRRAPRKRVKV
ncbi:MAG: hypothetical protein ACI4P0_05415 [Mailhella sp.]